MKALFRFAPLAALALLAACETPQRNSNPDGLGGGKGGSPTTPAPAQD